MLFLAVSHFDGSWRMQFWNDLCLGLFDFDCVQNIHSVDNHLLLPFIEIVCFVLEPQSFASYLSACLPHVMPSLALPYAFGAMHWNFSQYAQVSAAHFNFNEPTVGHLAEPKNDLLRGDFVLLMPTGPCYCYWQQLPFCVSYGGSAHQHSCFSVLEPIPWWLILDYSAKGEHLVRKHFSIYFAFTKPIFSYQRI